jgi:hypothetical protein
MSLSKENINKNKVGIDPHSVKKNTSINKLEINTKEFNKLKNDYDFIMNNRNTSPVDSVSPYIQQQQAQQFITKLFGEYKTRWESDLKFSNIFIAEPNNATQETYVKGYELNAPLLKKDGIPIEDDYIGCFRNPVDKISENYNYDNIILDNKLNPIIEKLCNDSFGEKYYHLIIFNKNSIQMRPGYCLIYKRNYLDTDKFKFYKDIEFVQYTISLHSYRRKYPNGMYAKFSPINSNKTEFCGKLQTMTYIKLILKISENTKEFWFNKLKKFWSIHGILDTKDISNQMNSVDLPKFVSIPIIKEYAKTLAVTYSLPIEFNNHCTGFIKLIITILRVHWRVNDTKGRGNIILDDDESMKIIGEEFQNYFKNNDLDEENHNIYIHRVENNEDYDKLLTQFENKNSDMQQEKKILKLNEEKEKIRFKLTDNKNNVYLQMQASEIYIKKEGEAELDRCITELAKINLRKKSY